MNYITILGVLFSLAFVPCHAQNQTTYEYDALNRLVKVTTPKHVTIYTYDTWGNRLSRKTSTKETAITPIKADGNFQLFPTTVKDKLTVLCPKVAIGQTLRIIDAEGRRIVEKQIEASSTTLLLERLPTGIYIATIKGSDGRTFTHKFINL